MVLQLLHKVFLYKEFNCPQTSRVFKLYTVLIILYYHWDFCIFRIEFISPSDIVLGKSPLIVIWEYMFTTYTHRQLFIFCTSYLLVSCLHIYVGRLRPQAVAISRILFGIIRGGWPRVAGFVRGGENILRKGFLPWGRVMVLFFRRLKTPPSYFCLE